MFVVTLGIPASGSTWVFNAVRALLAYARPAAESLSADHAAHLLDNVSLDARDVVVKAHSLDAPFLRLISLLDAKLIVSTRDPRDSLVSMIDRFSLGVREVMADLTRSFTSLAMLPPGDDRLTLRYEDGFTDDPQTIAAIARYLELDVPDDIVNAIHQQLRPGAVREQIAAMIEAQPGLAPVHDVATQWHPNHLSDGLIGKWRDRLSPQVQQAVSDCLQPFSVPGAWKRQALHWSSLLFIRDDNDQSETGADLICDGTERLLVFGPYLYLPPGRWRMTPLVELAKGSKPLTLKADVFIPAPGRDMLQLRTLMLPAKSPERMTLEFDHVDHLEPLEVRISSVRDGRTGRLRFEGAELSWIGPSEAPRTGEAVPVASPGPGAA